MSPSSKLPRFDPDELCPKCAHEELLTEWFENSRDWPCRPHYERIGHVEHLHRTCERCKHLWLVRPLTEDEVEEVQRELSERQSDTNDDDGLTPDLASDSMEHGL